MNCGEIEILLADNLDQAGLPEVRAHLYDCAQCRRMWQELQAIEALNFSLANLTGAPVDFSQRVGERLRRRRWRLTAWTIAATVALCCVGLAALRFSVEDYGLARDVAAGASGQIWQAPGSPNAVLLADPLASSDFEEQYLEIILGDSRGSSSTPGVPSEIKVYRTDMGRVNLTHVSH